MNLSLVFDLLAIIASVRLAINYHRLHGYVGQTKGYRLIMRQGAFQSLHFDSHLKRFALLAPYPFWTLTVILGVHGVVLIVSMFVEGPTGPGVPNFSAAICALFGFAFAVHTVFVMTYDLSEPDQTIADSDVLEPFRRVRSHLWRVGVELAVLTFLVTVVAASEYMVV